MSLTKLEENLSIIENLPDAPTMESNELKQKFDEGSIKIKDYINETLTVEIDSIVAQIKKEISNKLLEDNKKKYYVGKLIFDTKNVNPATYLGFGTWQLWGAGRVPVGVDTSQSEFNTVEKTGGEKTHKLTLAEIPSHTHTFKGNATSSAGAHTHTLNNHRHSFSGTTSNNGTHTHTLNNHTHSFSGTTSNNGTHTHSIQTRINSTPQDFNYLLRGSAAGKSEWKIDGNTYIGNSGAHTHTISGTTGGNNGNTSNNGNHTHTISGTTGTNNGNTSSNGAHTHTISGTNTNSGGSGVHNNLQPYITCYIWKRTA